MEQNKDQKNFSQQPKKQEAPNRGAGPRPEIELPLKGGRAETEWSQQKPNQQEQQGRKNPAQNDNQRTTR